MYLPNDTQIPMQCFDGMQKHTHHAQAVHRRHQLLADLTALADAADDKLSASPSRGNDGVDGPCETFSRRRIGLVEPGQARQGRGLGRQDVNGRGEKRFAPRVLLADIARRGRDGELRDGLHDRRHRHG